MPKTVSVVIATYNRFAALEQTLADLRLQTHRPLEVLVVDQSRDENGNPVDHHHDLEEFDELRYIHQAIPNAQAARNHGILAARGDIVLLIDDDVRMPRDFVANHLRNYEFDPDLDGVSGQTLEPGQLSTSEMPKQCSWPHIGWMFFPLNFSEKRPAINWPSCNGSVLRQMALSIGGFDEQFTRTWNDDTDFSWRLHTAGARIVFDPAASLVHLKIPSGGKRPSGKDQYVLFDPESWSVLFYYWRKNFGLIRAWRLVAHYMRGHLCRRVFLSRPASFLSACLNFIKGYHMASKKLKIGPLYIKDSDEKVASVVLQSSS